MQLLHSVLDLGVYYVQLQAVEVVLRHAVQFNQRALALAALRKAVVLVVVGSRMVL
jgi:hypothetical protein